MSATCRTCGYDSEDFKLLAQHIISQRLTHPKWQQKWAQKFLANATFLDQKVSRQNNDGRIPLTDQERENKSDCRREISGQLKPAFCTCPNCHKSRREMLPLEHYENPTAWKISNAFAVNCGSCRR